MLRLHWPLRAHQGLQRRLAFVVILAAMAFAGSDIASMRAARHSAVLGAWAESANLARSLSSQALDVFRLASGFTTGLRDRVEQDGGDPKLSQRTERDLAAALKALPMLHGVALLDARGHILAQAGSALPPAVLSSGADIFGRHRDTPDRGAFIGWPVQDPRDGTWQLTVSARIDTPRHEFDGVVIATLPVELFETMFSGYDEGAHGVISMLREDGIQIARMPLVEGGIGRFVEPLTRSPERANVEAVSPIDGVTRLFSYVWLPDLPVLVMVGRSKAEVLSGWRRMAWNHGIGLAIVLGILGTLSWRLSRSIGESERSRALLEQANARIAESQAQILASNRWLEMAEELAHVGHWTLSLSNGHSLEWSDEVYRLHGLDKAQFVPIAEDVVDSYHPEDRALIRNAVSESIATGCPFELLARINWPDGTTRQVLTRGCYLPDPPGGPPSVFGVIMDVTDQKETEAALVQASATAVAANAALETANRTLHALAMQDSLTGLSNRRHFDRALDQEFRRAVRGGTSLGLILLDVDQFKQFNDIYGHQAGDSCLRAIAHAIPALLNRPGDIAARYGGEEIALLLPGTTLSGANGLAERVAQAVRDLRIAHVGSPHGIVTVSAGVEAFVPARDVDTAALLVEHADLALYAAKHAGRDKIVSYHDLPNSEGASELRVFQA